MPHLTRPRLRLWLLFVTALVALVGVSATPAPARADTPSTIQAAYAATGGAAGPLGAATSAETCGLPQGGCTQGFEHGTYYWRESTGAHYVLSGVLATGYAALGGPGGAVGYPVTDPSCTPGLCAQQFASGDVLTSSPVRGLHHLTGGAAGQWWSYEGNVAGGLGDPISDSYAVGAWHEVDFQRGSLVDYGDLYPYVVKVQYALSDEWLSWGRAAGMGLPIAAESCGLVGGGCLQRFQDGALYWSPATGARAVRFALAQGYRGIAEQNGGLGYPVAEEGCGKRSGGCSQEFQGGTELWSPASGALAVRGALRSAYRAQGWENGRLGYPVTNEACGKRSGGCSQEFQGGTELWSPAGGAHSVLGAIRAEYQAQGWENGVLGYPISDEACGKRDGGCSQEFQGGTVLWSPSSGAHLVTGAVRSAYAARGWENSGYGYPVAEPTGAGNGRSAQRFQGGSITA
ncbi:hypothetical protein [Modestobacter sp. NPDC049651]|uniref:LGFP repeat-containing protein n=1 Tax=unclassified Modestobacter TaxID=2643866 RepID=UPI0033D54414